MKAINFLEWFNDYRIGKTQPADYDLSLINRVSTFLISNFKPELITELFDGFYTTSINNVVCINFETSNEAFKDRAFWKVTFYSGSHIEYENVFGKRAIIDFPQTLNDFISDCQRAGIELT